MARSLGIPHRLCAAEEKLFFGPRTIGRIFIEAYHLHWYFVGRYWAAMTRNARMLERLR
jgi:hypothetical protein